MTLDTLASARWFSTLDLVSGYWQVEVANGGQEQDCFLYNGGPFRVQSHALWAL